jgi:hypothetical protein
MSQGASGVLNLPTGFKPVLNASHFNNPTQNMNNTNYNHNLHS